MNTSTVTAAKKVSKPRKAPAKATVQAEVEDKTHAAWLVRDDKLLVASLGMDVFAIAGLLKREPISVLQRLLEPRVFDALETRGLDFEFENGSEEKAEFYGLALCGVPLESALRWCLATKDRPTTEQLDAMMSTPDLRPAMYLAREMDIWFSSADHIDDLRSLEDWPVEIVQAAVEEVVARFEAPTALMVLQQLEGVVPTRDRPYVWFDKDAPVKTSGLGHKRSSYKRKSKSTTGRTSSWKPYRKSRRSYAKRSYA